MQMKKMTDMEKAVPAAVLFFCAVVLGFFFAMMVTGEFTIHGFEVHLSHIWVLKGIVLVVVTGLFLCIFGSARDYFFSTVLISELARAKTAPLLTFPNPCQACQFKPPKLARYVSWFPAPALG